MYRFSSLKNTSKISLKLKIFSLRVFQRESLLTCAHSFFCKKGDRGECGGRGDVDVQRKITHGCRHVGERFPRNVKLRRFTNYGNLYI